MIACVANSILGAEVAAQAQLRALQRLLRSDTCRARRCPCAWPTRQHDSRSTSRSRRDRPRSRRRRSAGTSDRACRSARCRRDSRGRSSRWSRSASRGSRRCASIRPARACDTPARGGPRASRSDTRSARRACPARRELAVADGGGAGGDAEVLVVRPTPAIGRERGESAERSAAVRHDAHLDFVAHVPGLAVSVEEQLLHLLQVQRPRAAPAEHCDLVAGLVDAAVALQAARQAQRRPCRSRSSRSAAASGSGLKP